MGEGDKNITILEMVGFLNRQVIPKHPLADIRVQFGPKDTVFGGFAKGDGCVLIINCPIITLDGRRLRAVCVSKADREVGGAYEANQTGDDARISIAMGEGVQLRSPLGRWVGTRDFDRTDIR